VRGEHLAQRRGLARELVAELEALVADLLSLGERDLERRLAAERRQVVVAPGNRIDADLHVHDCLFLPSS
jgi:2-phospho-L-lactate guanylyltransferase (CobY/MobA/RfbA family)